MSIGPPFIFDPKRFRILLLDAGFPTLQAFVRHTGVPITSMTYIAQGARPSLQRQEEIARALKVRACDIWVPYLTTTP